MALHYHKGYGASQRSRNFGDDINPWFLPRLFRPEIIHSDRVCLVGIGTILNESNAAAITRFERKVVFTSGVGYGDLGSHFDSTWDFACVRGPLSARALGLPRQAGICDGAILLSDLYLAKPRSARNGTVFIPHVNTGWACGNGLRRICRDLSIDFLSPDAPFETFIETIRSARQVVTEAMHGAILADTLRTPWIPIEFLHHHEFKWHDWFGSLDLPYQCSRMEPVFWDKNRPGASRLEGIARRVYREAKQIRARNALRRILGDAAPVLSADEVLADRKHRLADCVTYINDTYST